MVTSPTTAPILTLSHNISIRPFLASDAASLAHHANDKEMWLNGPDIVPFPFTLVDGIAYIARANDTTTWAQPSASAAVPIMYAIALIPPSSSTEDDSKDNAKCIGSIEFVLGTDIHSRTFKLGYWLGREYWGKGIMSEVVTAFVDWIWGRFERVVRIEAEVHDFNKGGGGVLGKGGLGRRGGRRGWGFGGWLGRGL